MNITAEKHDSTLRRLISRLFDPVLLYTVMIMMSIMYHYRDKLVMQYGVVSLIAGYLLILLFDFINSHRLIGSVSYIVLWLLTIYFVGVFIERGALDYSIGFALWFFTPQNVLDYNEWYTRAIFLLFMLFMSSVIYYFTRVRYRLFMGFLIFMIPFSIYGKEYEKMPTHFIILLAVGYIVLMFYFKKLNEQGDVVIVNRRSIVSSAGVFTIIFAVCAAIVPKPYIRADRRAIETFISAERFTDKLVEKLSGFRDTTSGGQFRDVNSKMVLYLASADEPLHFKTATFSDYSYNSDSWSSKKIDQNAEATYPDAPIEFTGAGEFTEALHLAAKLDEDFAGKYGLTEFVGEELYTPPLKHVMVQSIYQSTKSAPVPSCAEALTYTTYDEDITMTGTGLLFSKNSKFKRTERFEFDYRADTFMAADVNRRFIASLDSDRYYEMLISAIGVLEKKEKMTDDDDEAELYGRALAVVRDERLKYRDYVLEMLDYGNNSRIEELARRITEGCNTEYEKACALEMYFFNNDYIYDLSYVKSSGENVESFLFNTHRGVCYEYATSMVLLARAVGIPARYCEGYNMTELSENESRGTNYEISTMDSHGYPELYIKGYGWMAFEPTISNGNAAEETGANASKRLTNAGFIMLAAALLLLIGYISYPFVSHKLFVLVSGKRTPDKTARSAMRRVCRLYKIGSGNTSDEARAIVLEQTGADITELAVLFDKTVYGEISLTEQEKEKVLICYTNAYNALREKKRSRSRRTKAV